MGTIRFTTIAHSADNPIPDNTANLELSPQKLLCDSCHRPVIGVAFLTPNDFLICAICEQSDTWRREELWLVRYLSDV